MDLELYQSTHGIPQLQQLLPMLATGSLAGNFDGHGGGGGALQQPNYVQLVRLLQCGLELVLHQAEAAHASKVSGCCNSSACLNTVYHIPYTILIIYDIAFALRGRLMPTGRALSSSPSARLLCSLCATQGSTQGCTWATAARVQSPDSV